MKRIFGIFIVLYSINAFAYYTETIPNQCGVIGNDLYAIFEINNYTCPSGQFLPADALGCVQCPNGYTCNGGTFSYNATESQGIEHKRQITTNVSNACSSNFGHELFAVFEPNQYTCQPGYYLPADAISCIQCPQNNKCTGGTYTFNETTNQGIEPCTDNTLHAPAGSAVCYPHILHLSSERPNDIIYLKSTATTSPAFNIDLNDDGTADAFANMTTTKTRMTNASEHYLKLTVNGVLYYVCDDTSCPPSAE